MEVFLSSILQISIQNKCKRIDIFVVCFQFLHIQVEKPRDFDPFGQTGLSPLATI